tara:strand:+ start:2976 stop:4475 length:1500 start_codon:yes stop_codon:yes gene_type:complete
MLGMFLKGLVGGAARGFSTAIKTRNKELRDMWDTAQQKYMDTIARETQQRALQRTQLLERMGRIESKGPAGTLTPAELYLLSKDDQTFGQVINDVDKGILTLAQVKKNIAFNGKSSPKYATKEQAIEANYDPSLAVRPKVVSTKTAFGIDSGIQQQRAQELEALVPSDSIVAKDAQGQPLQRVTGSYTPGFVPTSISESGMRSSLKQKIKDLTTTNVFRYGNSNYVIVPEIGFTGEVTGLEVKPAKKDGKVLSTADPAYKAVVQGLYKQVFLNTLESYGGITKQEGKEGAFLSLEAADNLKNYLTTGFANEIEDKDLDIFNSPYYNKRTNMVNTDFFRDAIEGLDIKPSVEIIGTAEKDKKGSGLTRQGASDEVETLLKDDNTYFKDNKALIQKYMKDKNSLSKEELARLEKESKEYGARNIDEFAFSLFKVAENQQAAVEKFIKSLNNQDRKLYEYLVRELNKQREGRQTQSTKAFEKKLKQKFPNMPDAVKQYIGLS